jgi:NADH:ubiquinone oxidoreductase subunit 4 (subunit M)
MVLAAMYMLRLVSALLHREVGEAVSKKAPDVLLPELCVIGALLGCMLALSIWPAAVSKNSFACLEPAATSGRVTAQVGLACVPGTSTTTTTTGTAK